MLVWDGILINEGWKLPHCCTTANISSNLASWVGWRVFYPHWKGFHYIYCLYLTFDRPNEYQQELVTKPTHAGPKNWTLKKIIRRSRKLVTDNNFGINYFAIIGFSDSNSTFVLYLCAKTLQSWHHFQLQSLKYRLTANWTNLVIVKSTWNRIQPRTVGSVTEV